MMSFPILAAVAITLFLGFQGPVQAHGDPAERISELKARLAQRPEDGPLQFALADLLFQERKWEETLTALDQVDRITPGKFSSGRLRGSALLELQRPAEALRTLDGYLDDSPHDLRAVLIRARALSALFLTNEALEAYRDTLRRTPVPGPELFHEVSLALSAAGCGREALAILDQGLELLGPIPSLGQQALDLELAGKQFDAALVRVEALRRASPRPEPWMARRAAILTSAGRLGESRGAWEALLINLTALPAAMRGSHAMSRLAEEARNGLRELQGLASLEIHQQSSDPPSPHQDFLLSKP